MKRAEVVVADSTQTKRDLIDFTHIDPAKVLVIHPGLNQAFAPDPANRPARRQRFGFGLRPVILQIGRGFYKNLPCVFRVLHKLRGDGIDACVARVGPPLAGTDRALAQRLGVLPYVIELGAVPDSDLPALYNAVDVLLFPSLYEGFGWPPLEAMASGTPVVCSRAGSLDEVIGDAALTADPEDVDTLVWHVGTVLTNDSVRDALIERGLARAATFSWDKAAEQMIGVYRNLIARS
jgi:glycosyltransferase involved in cell wall biosynthesis